MSYTPGPYTQTRIGPNPTAPRIKWVKRGTRQPRPIDKKKQFDYFVSYSAGEMVRHPVGYPPWTLDSGGDWQLLWSNPASSIARVSINDATAKARERCINKLYTKAELGVNLAQAGKSLDMITSRAVQATRAARALRKGRFREFLRHLGVKPLPKDHMRWRTRSRDASRLWLEYWFGWSPLINDIGIAVDNLQADYSKNISSVGTRVERNKKKQRNSYGWDRDYDYQWAVSVKVQAQIDVVNPNLFLANRLGFINPLVVLWDVIPFSFLADWLLPVSSFLNSFTEFVGLSIKKASSYTKVFWSGSETGSSTASKTSRDLRFSAGGWSGQRLLGFPSWKFRSVIKLPSPTRAATAISLLAQNLSRFPVVSFH